MKLVFVPLKDVFKECKGKRQFSIKKDAYRRFSSVSNEMQIGIKKIAALYLIASAIDGQRRLIAVVMGADSAKGREEEAKKLLRWGQQNFTTVQILHRRKKVGTERIWYGDKENIALGTEQEFWMVLPKAEIPHIKAKYTLNGKELTAPISAHQRVGEIELYDRDKQVAHWPLVTLESVGEGSMFSRLSDYFHHKA